MAILINNAQIVPYVTSWPFDIKKQQYESSLCHGDSLVALALLLMSPRHYFSPCVTLILLSSNHDGSPFTYRYYSCEIPLLKLKIYWRFHLKNISYQVWLFVFWHIKITSRSHLGVMGTLRENFISWVQTVIWDHLEIISYNIWSGNFDLTSDCNNM